MTIRIKRVYAEPAADDGTRILIDRLWPRNLSKDKAHIDMWLKDIAPSTGLRKWFGHNPARWAEFKHRYRAELKDKKMLTETILDQEHKGTVTLVYGSKKERFNNAAVLLEYLEARQP